MECTRARTMHKPQCLKTRGACVGSVAHAVALMAEGGVSSFELSMHA
jgi:hypothetical protein